MDRKRDTGERTVSLPDELLEGVTGGVREDDVKDYIIKLGTLPLPMDIKVAIKSVLLKNGVEGARHLAEEIVKQEPRCSVLLQLFEA